MSVSTEILWICLAVGGLTYALRVGGFWVMTVAPPGRFLRAWMESIPGAVLIAMVTPAAAQGSLPELAGIAVVLAVSRVWRNDMLSLAAGVGVVAALRAAGF